MAIAKVFAEIRGKKSISFIVRTPCHVREVESLVTSKFRPLTTLGDLQNDEKAIRNKFDFFEISEISVSLFLVDFGGARQS